MYREVLRSVELHKDKFRTDELQLLHTLHNLYEVLALKPEGVAPTLRDDQLTTQVQLSNVEARAKLSMQSNLRWNNWEVNLQKKLHFFKYCQNPLLRSEQCSSQNLVRIQLEDT